MPLSVPLPLVLDPAVDILSSTGLPSEVLLTRLASIDSVDSVDSVSIAAPNIPSNLLNFSRN